MSENTFSWLYPEMMSKSELVTILKQRYIQSQSLDRLGKNELVELYNKYIIPLPQRRYRVNRRGQEMTKKQIVVNKKRKITNANNDKGQPETKRRPAGKLLTSFDLPSTGGVDRLKPPPSNVNFEQKKIIINTNSSRKNKSPPSLDRLKINKGSESDKQSSKKIKISNGPSKTSSEVKRMKLEEPAEKDGSTSPMDCSTDEISVKEKKIKKITWP